MDFGPIGGIGPLALLSQAERPDLAGVIAVELRKQGRDDNGASEQKASRGLEEEEDQDDGLSSEEEHADGASGGPTINVFA